MAILIISEHDNAAIKSAVLNTVAAGRKLGEDIHVLVAGFECSAAAEAAANVEGVTKVLMADAERYQYGLAEDVANIVVSVAENYSHILAPATSFGKMLCHVSLRILMWHKFQILLRLLAQTPLFGQYTLEMR